MCRAPGTEAESGGGSCVQRLEPQTGAKYSRESSWISRLLKETDLKYVCLVYGEEQKIAAMRDDECMAYDRDLRQSGRCIASEALQAVSTAKTVRVRNGKISITDGPFTETKEFLAGFYLIEASDMNEATRLAAEIPPAQVGSIEVRPVRELLSTAGERRDL